MSEIENTCWAPWADLFPFLLALRKLLYFEHKYYEAESYYVES